MQDKKKEDSAQVLAEIAELPQPEVIVEKKRHHKFMRIGGHTYCLKKDHRRQSVNTKGTSSNTDKEMTLDDIEITFQKKTPSVPTAKSNEVRFNQFLF